MNAFKNEKKEREKEKENRISNRSNTCIIFT